MTKEKLHYPDRFLNRGLSKATALVLVTLAIGLSGCQAGTASNTTPVVDSEKNYGVSPFHAHIKSMGSDSQSALADALKKATGIQCLTGSGGENSAVSVITQPNALVVRRKDGTELTRLQVPHDQTPSPKQLLAIGEILKSEYKRSFFLDLRRSNADLKLEVRCIPVVKSVEVVEGKKTVRLEDKPFDGGKTLSLQQGEPFMIEIRNLGTKRSFFNVLNIGPGSSVAQIYPSVDRPYKQENFVDPDRQWHRIPRPYVWSASPPFGTELIKVIATLEPYDFSLLMDPDAPRQDVNKLGELGKLIYSANTCNGVEQISPEVEWSTTQTSIQTRAGNVVAESGSEPSKQKLADKDEKLLSKPERITVYSIKPDAVSRDKKAGFQGYPIELATEVGDPYSRHEIAQALMKSIKEPEGRKRCWIPHHAVRVVSCGETVDFVICYTCNGVSLDGGSDRSYDISRYSEQFLDESLLEKDPKLFDRIKKDVVTLIRGLPQGHTLTAADVTTKKVWPGDSYSLCNNIDEVVGKKLKQDSYKGWELHPGLFSE